MKFFSNESIEQFNLMIANVTTDELRQLLNRLQNGQIVTSWYVNDGCGCVIGTLGMIQGVLNDESGLTDGYKYRADLLGDQLDRFIGDGERENMTIFERDLLQMWGHTTPDEDEVAFELAILIESAITARTTVPLL